MKKLALTLMLFCTPAVAGVEQGRDFMEEGNFFWPQWLSFCPLQNLETQTLKN